MPLHYKLKKDFGYFSPCIIDFYRKRVEKIKKSEFPSELLQLAKEYIRKEKKILGGIRSSLERKKGLNLIETKNVLEKLANALVLRDLVASVDLSPPLPSKNPRVFVSQAIHKSLGVKEHSRSITEKVENILRNQVPEGFDYGLAVHPSNTSVEYKGDLPENREKVLAEQRLKLDELKALSPTAYKTARKLKQMKEMDLDDEKNEPLIEYLWNEIREKSNRLTFWTAAALTSVSPYIRRISSKLKGLYPKS